MIHTHIVVDVLATNVEQSVREVAIRHLQAVVQRPERCTETRTDPGETTAGRRVRLEHDEGLPGLLRDHCRVQVRLNNAHAGGVVEVLRKLDLRVYRSAKALVDGSAVVIRVAVGR